MFDFLRNLTKSAEEKRQEQLQAYLDDALAPRQRQQFEQELAQDASLRAQVDDLRLLKQQLRQMPRRSVPRSFTLDPAVYGRPAPQPLFQFYPLLQGATALTALLFVLVITLSLFQNQAPSASVAAVPAAESAQTEVVAEEPPALAATDAAAEAANGEAASDEAEEEVLEEEAMSDSAETAAMEVEESVEEQMEEETAEDSGEAADMAPEPTQLPPEVGAGVAAVTMTPEATATVSTLPRPLITDTEEARNLALPTEVAVAQDAVADDDTADIAQDEVAPAPTSPITQIELQPVSLPVAWLTVVQVGLAALLIVLGAFTLYVRRRL